MEKKPPANARGIPAASKFWAMSEADQERYRSGWWDRYDKKDPRVGLATHEAYKLGRDECERACFNQRGSMSHLEGSARGRRSSDDERHPSPHDSGFVEKFNREQGA